MDNKLNGKCGEHKIEDKYIEGVGCAIPTQIIEAVDPSAKVTLGKLDIVCTDVYLSTLPNMYSVAPNSITQYEEDVER